MSRLARLLSLLSGRRAAEPPGPAEPSQIMKLVVGLGNPGSQYAQTRHNVGFWVVERLARRLGWGDDFKREAREKFHGLAQAGQVQGIGRIMLLEPMTWMNASGRSVQAAARFYNIAPADILVVVDDIALPAGKIRLRPSGSHGGHNGLRDIEAALGTQDYPRLRIGIDPPPPQMAGKDYVLGRFTEAQREALEPALERAAEAAMVWMENGIEAAMNRFNA